MILFMGLPPEWIPHCPLGYTHHFTAHLPSPKRLPSARLLEAGLRAGRLVPPEAELVRDTEFAERLIVYGESERYRFSISSAQATEKTRNLVSAFFASLR
jgi:hypothetical protein